MIPTWLHILAIAALALGLLCALAICADVLRHNQRMAIMDVVWPVTALFGTVLTLRLYWRYGRASTDHTETPFWAKVANGASHCGAGCTLGDILANWWLIRAGVKEAR